MNGVGGMNLDRDLDYESSTCDCNSCCGTTSSKRKFNCQNNSGAGGGGGAMKKKRRRTDWCGWCCGGGGTGSNPMREFEDENYSEICSNNRSVR